MEDPDLSPAPLVGKDFGAPPSWGPKTVDVGLHDNYGTKGNATPPGRQ